MFPYRELITVAISALITGGLVALLAWAYPKLKNEKQGYYLEDEIEEALLPIAYQAICAAFKISEASARKGGQLLDGLEKKELANMLYEVLPESIGGVPVGQIKKLVSKEQFAEFVEGAYQDFDERYHSWLGQLDTAFEKWQLENSM